MHETSYIRSLFDKYNNKFLNTRADFLETGSIYNCYYKWFLFINSIQHTTRSNTRGYWTVCKNRVAVWRSHISHGEECNEGFVSAYQIIRYTIQKGDWTLEVRHVDVNVCVVLCHCYCTAWRLDMRSNVITLFSAIQKSLQQWSLSRIVKIISELSHSYNI